LIRRLGWLATLAVACGGGHPTPKPPVTPVEPPATADAPSDRECDELVAHAVELHVAELRAARPNQLPTEAEQQTARREIHAALGGECRRVARTAYACAIAAKTTAELTSCDR